jgi:predicted ester cyclase
MSIEENKALVRRYCTADAGEIKKSKTAVEDEYHSQDIKVHTSIGHLNLTEYWDHMDSLLSAFPDGKYNAEDVIAEGDKAVCRYSFTGTHKNAFMNIPPTGKKVKIEGMGIFRISGGKFVEIWYATDVMGMMQQLGAIPSQ